MRKSALQAGRTPLRWEVNDAFIDALRAESVVHDPYNAPKQWFGIPMVVGRSDSTDPVCQLIVETDDRR